MPTRPLTAAATTLLSILEYAEELAPGARADLERALVPPGTAWDDPNARVEAHLVPMLLAAAAERTGESGFGLRLALRGNPRRFGLLAYVNETAATLGESLQRGARYLALWNEGNEVRIVAVTDAPHTARSASPRSAPGVIAIEVRPRGLSASGSPEGVRHLLELATASILILSRAYTGDSVLPRAVELGGTRGAPAELYEKVYGRVPRFGAPVTRLVLDARLLELPLRGADPSLSAILRRSADEILARLGASTLWADRVKSALVERLGRTPVDVAAVAKALGMSRRTLQRRLADEETAYDALLDAVRHDLATRYLADPDMSTTEVAALLGFSDVSAFYRAFRRWTGSTPRGIPTPRART